MNRTWLYQRMMADGPLLAKLPGGIHQSTSLNKAPHEKPFIMYRQTSEIDLARGDDISQVGRLGYMVFVHDIPGDYLRIDDVLLDLKRLFRDTIDQANGVIRSNWLETSDDFRDEDMGTIIKFARLQITYRV